jgi:hypothetical protein
VQTAFVLVCSLSFHVQGCDTSFGHLAVVVDIRHRSYVIGLVQAAPEDFAKHNLSEVLPARFPYPPHGMPPLAFHFTDEVLHASPWDPVPVSAAVAGRHAYRATVTGMDRKLGVLLEALANEGRWQALCRHYDALVAPPS